MKTQKTMFKETPKDPNLFFKVTISILLFCLTLTSIYFAIFAMNLTKTQPLTPISLPHKSQDLMTITSVGDGEVEALPDIATIVATIKDSGANVALAQKLIDQKAKNLAIELEKLGIDKKDIRSTSYRTSPKYERVSIPCKAANCGFKNEIIGYQATQTIKIKSHKMELAGEIITTLGKLGINQISGPNFAIENSEKLKSSARLIAIKNSQEKAEEISKALGVKIGKIVKFTENNSNRPVMFRSMSMKSEDSNGGAKLFAGEETIKSKVTIIYSIQQ
ncbi:MAG: hypothetical protein ACJA0S_000864 [Rickettsiales bacterium]|jgi:uncharacterized protein YggE